MCTPFLRMLKNVKFRNCMRCSVLAPYTCLKPWPNETQVIASRRKFCYLRWLAYRLATHLHSLAKTCDDLRRLAFDLNMFKFWTQVRPTCVSFGHSTQVDASFRKSFELFWKPFSQSDAAVWAGISNYFAPFALSLLTRWLLSRSKIRKT